MSLDCEYGQPSKRTIEIGAAIFDVKTGKQLGSFNTYVNPNEPISEFITNLTTITDEKVKNAPQILEAYNELKKWHQSFKSTVHTPIVWGGGASNDSHHIWSESKDTEHNFMGFRTIDAKALYQSLAIYNEMGLQGGLGKACDKLGIGFEGVKHTALADAINTFRLWHHLTVKLSKGHKDV
jgi:DNA polymerase III alpha subunit (gram-positive type)